MTALPEMNEYDDDCAQCRSEICFKVLKYHRTWLLRHAIEQINRNRPHGFGTRPRYDKDDLDPALVTWDDLTAWKCRHNLVEDTWEFELGNVEPGEALRPEGCYMWPLPELQCL